MLKNETSFVLVILTIMIWHIQINPKLWDVVSAKTDFHREQQLYIPFPKGRTSIREGPQVHDEAFLICKGNVIFKGYIVQGFTKGVLHRYDKYNLRQEREHASVDEYAMVVLTESVDNEQMTSNRRTWTKKDPL